MDVVLGWNEGGNNTQMKATHTPAPWKIAGKSGNDHEAFVIDAESRSICWTTNTLDCDTDEETITEEDKANAHLIAAAPELLAAAKSALRALRSYNPGPLADKADPVRTVIIAAIAKAEGTYKTNNPI